MCQIMNLCREFHVKMSNHSLLISKSLAENDWNQETLQKKLQKRKNPLMNTIYPSQQSLLFFNRFQDKSVPR